MTTDDLKTGLPAATRCAALRARAACALAFWVLALPAFAQPAAESVATLQVPQTTAVPSVVATASPVITIATGKPAPIVAKTGPQSNATDPATPVESGASSPTIDVSTEAPLEAGVINEPGVSEKIQTVLQRALALLGTPYRWGGMSPISGFDCSGLVNYVFRTTIGIELPRVSRDMAKRGELIRDRASLIPGDLVFFNSRGRGVSHVGIYLGEGRFVHAPRTGKDVQVDSLITGYWARKYLQARRVEGI